MTDPIEPTPGAPAEPPTPQPAPQQQPEPFDPKNLTPEAQAWLAEQIKAADLKARTGSKANAAAEARAELTAQFAKVLGLAEEPPNPDALMAEIEYQRNLAWVNAMELELHRVAGSLGADAEAMMDSRRFLDSLDDLTGMDPTTAEFREQLKAKVQAAAAKYPAQQNGGQAPTGPRPDPSQGARSTGQPRPTSLTQAVAQAYAERGLR